MKNILTLMAICVLCIANAQSTTQASKYTKEVQNFIEISPSKAKKINGLNFKLWYDEENNQQINGLELGLNPLMLFGPFMTAIYSPVILDKDVEVHNSYRPDIFKKINGLQISLGSIEDLKTNGIAINISGNLHAITNGIAISPVINQHYEVSGLSISFLGNADYKMRGIQIGLFNRSKDLRGIQLGLWNKNDKRSLPFINWQFKS
jgi:hypothetical protein